MLPLALAAGLWWAYGGRVRFRWLALVCGAGVALHLLYDLTTSWGTMLLFPFSNHRYALDWLFIVDFVTWAVPVAVLLAARVWPERARSAVVAGMLALLGYGAAAALVHRSAVAAVSDAERENGVVVAEALALPRAGAPWRWNGYAVQVHGAPDPRIGLYEVRGIPPRAAPAGRLARGFDDPWARAALATRAGQSYLWWARVPVADVEHDGSAIAVTLRDLRFRRAIPGAGASPDPFALRLRFEERTGRLLVSEW